MINPNPNPNCPNMLFAYYRYRTRLRNNDHDRVSYGFDMFQLRGLRHKTILVVVSIVDTLPGCEAVLRRLADSSGCGGEPIRASMMVCVCDVHVYEQLNGGRWAGYGRYVDVEVPVGMDVPE